MFPVQGRGKPSALPPHVYREFDDLSHCYPDEINAPVLAWLCEEVRGKIVDKP